jgi:hypothetical protein
MKHKNKKINNKLSHPVIFFYGTKEMKNIMDNACREFVDRYKNNC